MGGPSFVKDLLGPMPWSKIIIIRGVDSTEESVSQWIKAGSCCLGLGSRLITKNLITQRKNVSLSQQIGNCLKNIKSARKLIP